MTGILPSTAMTWYEASAAGTFQPAKRNSLSNTVRLLRHKQYPTSGIATPSVLPRPQKVSLAWSPSYRHQPQGVACQNLGKD